MPDPASVAERELAALDAALAGRPVPAEHADLADLARLMAAERPQLPGAFAAELDARAARGFATPAPGQPRRRSAAARPRRSWLAWLRSPLVLGAASTVVLIVAAMLALPNGEPMTSGGAGSSSGGAMAPSGAQAARETAGGEAADGAASVAPVVPVPPEAGAPGADRRRGRRVERTASLTLATSPAQVDAVSARVQQVTREHGGFVASSSVSSSAAGGGGSFALRIPTRNLDAAMAALARLGRVRERSQHTRDITAQAVSARGRLREATTERRSLLGQLARAATPQQTAAIRARLRLVAAEIARARTGVRRVGNRAAFASVAVALLAEDADGIAATEDEDGWTPGEAARDALAILELAAGIALVALAVAAPLGLLLALGFGSARWGARRRRERALDLA